MIINSLTQHPLYYEKINLFEFLWTTLFLYSCSSQINIDPKTLEEITTSNQFTFMAERANPTNFDVINIMNSMPNGNSSRMLDLDYGYTVVLKEKRARCYFAILWQNV